MQMPPEWLSIVQVVESLDVGGAERVAVELSNALCKRNRVVVVCVKRHGALRAELSKEIDVVCLDRPEGNDFRSVARIRDVVRIASADVVHSHHWGVLAEVGLALRSLSPRVFVHTAHGRYPPHASSATGKIKNALRHIMERRLVRKGCQIVCVSEELASYVNEELGVPLASLKTIPNGVDTEGPGRARNDRTAVDYRFIAVGRMVQVKNLPLLIKAFEIVHRVEPGIVLRLVGDGPERPHLERMVNTVGLGHKIEFLGFRSEVAALFADSDAFVIPSLMEGMPMALLEAMRSRLPVIATRVGGIPRVITDGRSGLLVESRDVQALANAMLQLARSADRGRGLGESGYAELVAKFSLSQMVHAYERIYSARPTFRQC
jgi:glycosyltransferase involved in cell wall biosynthesis